MRILEMKQTIITDRILGHLLQGRRKSRGLTQAQLAQRVGISQERLSVLELNPGRITVERLLRLASVLGLELVVQEKTVPPPNESEW